MSVEHNNEPRNVGYSKDAVDLYQNPETTWLKKNSHSIFAGKMQKDLFIFAMALGKHREMKSGFTANEKLDNVSVGAMNPLQKWALLSLGIAENNDLLCLKDEGPIYKLAETYAREGIQILKSRMDHAGINYSKELELELRQILGLV